MEKTKKIICPSCGRIKEIKELNFDCLVIEGKVKEILKDIKGVQISGIEFCPVCR